jgi:GTP-binding protein
MRRQTDLAIEESDVCLMLIDARAGVTPLDAHFGDLLRRGKTPVILLANKCEGKAGRPGLYESYSLGLGDPVAISAEHGEGLTELYEALRPMCDAYDERAKFEKKEDELELDLSAEELGLNADEEAITDVDVFDFDDEDEGEEGEEVEPDLPSGPMRIAIVGRPNAGKSTLINYIVGSDRLLTGPEAGLTRDSISVAAFWDGEEVKLYDTAGMRKKARVQSKLEKLSVADGLRAVKFAEVVVLMIDSQSPLDKQDLQIAALVAREGRSLVVGINKWDLVEDKPATLKKLREDLENLLPQVRGVPLITFSALTGKGINRLMPAIKDVYDKWNARVRTSQLNKWLDYATQRHAPPAVSGRHIRLRYGTKAKTRPPTFVFFASRPEKLPESYNRYLINSLREEFNLDGVPIRIAMRKGENPYAKKKKRNR